MVHELVNYNRNINLGLNSILKDFSCFFGFNYFGYIKLNSDNSRILLSNNIDWVDTYVTLELYNEINHEVEVIRPMYKRKIAFWDGYHNDKVFNLANTVNMWHGIIVHEGDEIFSFSTHKGNINHINKFLSYVDLLDQFIFYFRDKAKRLPPLSKDYLLFSNCNLGTKNSTIDQSKNILNLMPIKHYYIQDSKGYEYQITRREAQTLQLLANGKTFAEAAACLGISTRTLEKYVDSLKRKFKLFCKSKLIDIYHQANLSNIKL